MNISRIFFILSFVFFSLQHTIAQEENHTIVGRVTNANGDPSIGATVALIGSSAQAITDENGDFTLVAPNGVALNQLEVTPAPKNPSGKETFDITKSILTAVVDGKTIQTVGTLLLPERETVPGISDFTRKNYYLSTDSGFATQQIGDLVDKKGLQIIDENMPKEKKDEEKSDDVPPSLLANLNCPPLPTDLISIGYDRISKKTALGSVSSINEKDFNKGVNTHLETLFQGKLAGAQITASDGDVGAPTDLVVRGASSILLNRNPLFVVDGVPITYNMYASDVDGESGLSSASGARNFLNFINPNDIERIDIVKDIATASIYGGRASNGIVFITTKTGYCKPFSIDVNAQMSVSQINSDRKLELLNRNDFLSRSFFYNNQRTGISQADFNTAYDLGGDVDWQNEIYRLAYAQNYNVGLQGGDKTTAYRFSIGYFNQQGIVKNSSLERWTARFNGSKKLFNNIIEVGTNLSVAFLHDTYAPLSDSVNLGQVNLIGAALSANPAMPVYERERKDNIANNPSLGNRYTQNTLLRNPAAMLDYIDENSNTIRFLGNVFVKAKITKWLDYKINFGLDYSANNRNGSYDYFLDINPIARQYANNDAKARDDINLAISYGGLGYIKNFTQDNRLIENTLNVHTKFSDFSLNALLGHAYQYFSYSLSSVSARSFPENRFLFYRILNRGEQVYANSVNTQNGLNSFFGRVNLSYKEKYMLQLNARLDNSKVVTADNGNILTYSALVAWKISNERFIPKFFDDLKLRVGYGIAGNTSILYVITTNPNLKAEMTTGIDAGLDFAILKNRVYGSVDYFYKSTTDLILPSEVLPSQNTTGYIFENVNGEIINNGVDAQINAVPIAKAVKWTIGLNFTYLQNTVEKLDAPIGTGVIDAPNNFVGTNLSQYARNTAPLNAFYVNEFVGYNAAGVAQYLSAAQTYIANPNPDYLFGITNALEYKNWDLSILLNGVAGNKIYNNTAQALFNSISLSYGRNATSSVANSEQSAADQLKISSQYIEDGSFLRLANITLGYNIPIKSKHIKGLRVYGVAQNVLVITGYSGYDPEVNTNKPTSGIPSNGIDYYSSPRARTFTLGVNVSL